MKGEGLTVLRKRERPEGGRRGCTDCAEEGGQVHLPIGTGCKVQGSLRELGGGGGLPAGPEKTRRDGKP